MNGVRGIPQGVRPRRLTDEQRQTIISMLKTDANCLAVTKRYQELVGPVTHMTVCSIKNQLIADGILEPVRFKKCNPEFHRNGPRGYYQRNREAIVERQRAARRAGR